MKKQVKIEKHGTHDEMMKSKNIDAIDYECNIGMSKFRAKFWSHIANCYDCMNMYQEIMNHVGSYDHTNKDAEKSEKWSKKWNESK